MEEYWPLKSKGKDKGYFECANIMVLGPLGAGKSSFVNTVYSAIAQKIATPALVEQVFKQSKSITKKVSYYILMLFYNFNNS